jgi:hypothetical protein
LLIDDTAAYWATIALPSPPLPSKITIRRMPKHGGTITDIAQGEGKVTSGFGSFTMDSEYVYWTDPAGLIRRAPKAGEDPQTLASDQTNTSLGGLLVDDACIYWVAWGSAAGDQKIVKMAKPQ